MKHRHHGEIAPLHRLATISGQGEVSIVFFVESVLLIEVTVYLFTFVDDLLCFFQLLGAVQGFCPQVLVGIELLKLLHVHGFLDFILHHRHHVADGVDGVASVFGGVHVGKQVSGIPWNEVHFLQFLELLYAGAVAVRVVLALRFAQGDFFHGDAESRLHGQQSVSHHVSGTGTQLLAFIRLWRVGVRQEADLRGIFFKLLQLELCPVTSQRCDGVVYADALQLHHVRSTLHKIELRLLGRLADSEIDAEDAVLLMIDITLNGIQVFGRVFRPAHITGGEADYPPKTVADGYHDTVAVEIIYFAIFTGLQQPHLRHQLDGQAGCLCEL